MKAKRIAIITGIVVVLAIIVGANVAKSNKNVPLLEAQIVTRGHIQEVVRADGEIKAEKQVDIGSDIMGRIEKIYVRLGDYVKKGDTLCLIDKQSYEAKVNSLKMSLNDLKSKLDKAQKDFERIKNLYEKGLVAETDYENSRLQLESLKAQYQSTYYSLKDAEYQLSKTVITSPITGKVISLNKEAGEIVVMGTVNNPATVIMTIAELSKMKVNAYVDESEIVKVKEGQPVNIKVTAYPDKNFRGIVKAISAAPYQGASTTTTSGVQYSVEVAVVDTGILYPGMSATCEIIVSRKDSVLKVPVQALGKEKTGEDYLFLIKGGKVYKTFVKIGAIASNEAEILEGVSEGDTIAVGPYSRLRILKDGQKVKFEIKRKVFEGKQPTKRFESRE
uniref:Efflux RND transporter periplasmic adaptor subunit n=2 Tax=candidate division WOR-3 bacterium TaxID=2052148 RepID=A0A7V4E4R8_UNCW3